MLYIKWKRSLTNVFKTTIYSMKLMMLARYIYIYMCVCVFNTLCICYQIYLKHKSLRGIIDAGEIVVPKLSTLNYIHSRKGVEKLLKYKCVHIYI